MITACAVKADCIDSVLMQCVSSLVIMIVTISNSDFLVLECTLHVVKYCIYVYFEAL